MQGRPNYCSHYVLRALYQPEIGGYHDVQLVPAMWEALEIPYLLSFLQMRAKGSNHVTGSGGWADSQS